MSKLFKGERGEELEKSIEETEVYWDTEQAQEFAKTEGIPEGFNTGSIPGKFAEGFPPAQDSEFSEVEFYMQGHLRRMTLTVPRYFFQPFHSQKDALKASDTGRQIALCAYIHPTDPTEDRLYTDIEFMHRDGFEGQRLLKIHKDSIDHESVMVWWLSRDARDRLREGKSQYAR